MNDQTSDGSHVSISRRTILKAAGGVALIGTVPGVGAANTLEIHASSPACGELRVSATGEGSVYLTIDGPLGEIYNDDFDQESSPLDFFGLDVGPYTVLWDGGQIIVGVEACPDDPDPDPDEVQVIVESPACEELRLSFTGEGEVHVDITGPNGFESRFTVPVPWDPVHYPNLDAGEYEVRWDDNHSDQVTVTQLVEACSDDPDPVDSDKPAKKEKKGS
jgi:hypothetical protein